MMSVMSAGAGWSPSGASGGEEVRQTSFKCWDVLIHPASQPIIMGNLLVIHNSGVGRQRPSYCPHIGLTRTVGTGTGAELCSAQETVLALK